MFWGSGKVEHTSESKQKALQELRSRLAATQIHQQLVSGHEPGVSTSSDIDDGTLTRWLVAEDWSATKAFQRLCSHAPWRASTFPQGRIQENDIQSELQAKKAFLQGTDKQGRAVAIVKGSKHSKINRNLEECKRLICYCLDGAIDRCDLSKNPTGKVVAIFDLRGISNDAMDTSALHAVFDLMQNHYPERLGMLWMYEASFFFNSIWKVVSPFIDTATKAKIRFIGKEGQAELQSIIDASVLPKDLGGQAELIPIQDMVAQMNRNNQREAPPAHSASAESGSPVPSSSPAGAQYSREDGNRAAAQNGQSPQLNTGYVSQEAQPAPHGSIPPAERLPERMVPAQQAAAPVQPQAAHAAMQDMSLQSPTNRVLAADAAASSRGSDTRGAAAHHTSTGSDPVLLGEWLLGALKMSSHDAPGDLATSSAGSLQKSLVQCSRVDKKQYIWTAQGAKRIRKDHKVMGSMVGGISRFCQQSSLKGLPLQLSDEESHCGFSEGWAQDFHVCPKPAGTNVRAATCMDSSTSSDDDEGGLHRQKAACDLSWLRRLAVTESTITILPKQLDSKPTMDLAQANLECTSLPRQVYQDLHKKGYSITHGSKFGADYLLYPGDPTLYHAQFCTRLMEPCQPVGPISIAAASRGSHIALEDLDKKPSFIATDSQQC
ncbi:hypothetical protein WJX84_001947 [Apatococcus fuscideae]|uniref:tRNA-intron lyase n=1 Tax=Apatococcus fuscideae TaxID=2026836 RepID=A0AAW1T1I7_9CHLO